MAAILDLSLDSTQGSPSSLQTPSRGSPTETASCRWLQWELHSGYLGYSVDSIQGRVIPLLCRLHSDVSQWKQQHVDGCSVDSIPGQPNISLDSMCFQQRYSSSSLRLFIRPKMNFRHYYSVCMWYGVWWCGEGMCRFVACMTVAPGCNRLASALLLAVIIPLLCQLHPTTSLFQFYSN
jgi:hypothetical protein